MCVQLFVAGSQLVMEPVNRLTEFRVFKCVTFKLFSVLGNANEQLIEQNLNNVFRYFNLIFSQYLMIFQLAFGDLHFEKSSIMANNELRKNYENPCSICVLSIPGFG